MMNIILSNQDIQKMWPLMCKMYKLWSKQVKMKKKNRGETENDKRLNNYEITPTFGDEAENPWRYKAFLY